jgi:bacteriophage N4 adsorption protein B
LDGLIPTLVYELLLFAACGMLLFGIDDFIVDLIWLWHHFRTPKVTVRVSDHAISAKIAVFVPAWREQAVIGHMIRRCLTVWDRQDFCLFVGTYPNDPETATVIKAFHSDQIKHVILSHDGPTTKADCLNGIWQAMGVFEQQEGVQFEAVLLHDAEDRVHGGELTLFGSLCRDHDLIQIPVVPEPVADSRWIAGHYLDEFAEAHRKELIVRQALGASVPSAGTGCALSRRALDTIAGQKGGLPFDDSSLTEDYELGLRFWQEGFSSRFVRAVDQLTETEIVVRSCFPATVKTAVRQKTRWIIGIALAGWDRSGWRGRVSEHWMRWRDRRVILAAALIFAGYSGMVLWLSSWALGRAISMTWTVTTLFGVNFMMLLWRLLFRAYFTTLQYGWGEGACSVPRLFVGNVIAVMAASRALVGYIQFLFTGHVVWDKTSHIFAFETKPQHP